MVVGWMRDVGRAQRFAVGGGVTVEELEGDPHALLARLREREPVSWVPALDGWLVTRRDLAMQVMRDADTFTVDDARFSTGQVVGPSMLTRDGEAHRLHRDPFAAPFRRDAVHARFTQLVAGEAERLIAAIEPAGHAELRSAVAGPLAVAVMARALGLRDADAGAVLGWYARIVGAVTDITAGQPLSDDGRDAYAALSAAIAPALERGPEGGAYAELSAAIAPALQREPEGDACDAQSAAIAHALERGPEGDAYDALSAAIAPALERKTEASLLAAAASEAGGLERERVISNAAVLLFGGIETTEGMIANAVWHLLSHPDQLARVRARPALLANAVEESLRLEPAAAVVDRYATRDVELAGAAIARGDLVRVSIAAANRDPAVFANPDRFDIERSNAHRHLAFAHGPHSCIGMHLARLEAVTALELLLSRLPDLRLDPANPSAPRGLVFRKPPQLRVLWTSHSASPAAA
jgi:cytochrome P450